MCCLRIHEIAYVIIGHPDNSEYIVPVHVGAMKSVRAAQLALRQFDWLNESVVPHHPITYRHCGLMLNS